MVMNENDLRYADFSERDEKHLQLRLNRIHGTMEELNVALSRGLSPPT